MHRHPNYLTDTIPGQGRRPPLEVTLHAEDEALILAVALTPGKKAPKHPPGPATLASLVSMVAAEVGPCALGDWEPYAELDGSQAGWMTSVLGEGVASKAKALTKALTTA